MINSYIITIDGYVATGKGTTAKGVAKALSFVYLDTGSMYRAVTLYAIRCGLLDSIESIKFDMMQNISISFHYNEITDHNDVFLNGENVEKEIRQLSLTSQMKSIVTSPVVRSSLVEMQQKFTSQSLVADGRDMGTVVFPFADLKVFLTCDIHERAKRRHEQLKTQNIITNIDLIYKDIQERDKIDYLGFDAINCIPKNALIIDTTFLSIDGVVDKIVSSFLLNKNKK